MWAKMIGGGGVQKSYNGIEPEYPSKLPVMQCRVDGYLGRSC